VAEQAVANKNPVPAPRPVYEKPTLQRLGLLRLMTRYSFAGEDDHRGHHNRGDH
jgi:hypothetical protein